MGDKVDVRNRNGVPLREKAALSPDFRWRCGRQAVSLAPHRDHRGTATFRMLELVIVRANVVDVIYGLGADDAVPPAKERHLRKTKRASVGARASVCVQARACACVRMRARACKRHPTRAVLKRCAHIFERVRPVPKHDKSLARPPGGASIVADAAPHVPSKPILGCDGQHARRPQSPVGAQNGPLASDTEAP